MSGTLLALYFLFAPPLELLSLDWHDTLIAARSGDRYLRWASRGQREVVLQGRRLALLSAPAKLVADFQDEGFLRMAMEPNVADNAVFYGPDALQIFVNGRKLSCRKEGDNRRLFYPVLNNREPCER